MHHDPINIHLWPRLYREFPAFQVAVCDETGKVAAAGNTIPVSFDVLPDTGWDAALEEGFRVHDSGRQPNLLSALLAIVDAEHQGKGLSRLALKAMRNIAAKRGFSALVAPVRPSLKHRYPLTPMETYIRWRREDGRLFDPWMRVHERLGAEVVRIAPESMTVAEWESWTRMRFPESGEYVIEGALCPVEISVERDLGRYVEPNVWMLHAL